MTSITLRAGVLSPATVTHRTGGGELVDGLSTLLNESSLRAGPAGAVTLLPSDPWLALPSVVDGLLQTRVVFRRDNGAAHSVEGFLVAFDMQTITLRVGDRDESLLISRNDVQYVHLSAAAPRGRAAKLHQPMITKTLTYTTAGLTAQIKHQLRVQENGSVNYVRCVSVDNSTGVEFAPSPLRYVERRSDCQIGARAETTMYARAAAASAAPESDAAPSQSNDTPDTMAQHSLDLSSALLNTTLPPGLTVLPSNTPAVEPINALIYVAHMRTQVVSTEEERVDAVQRVMLRPMNPGQFLFSGMASLIDELTETELAEPVLLDAWQSPLAAAADFAGNGAVLIRRSIHQTKASSGDALVGLEIRIEVYNLTTNTVNVCIEELLGTSVQSSEEKAMLYEHTGKDAMTLDELHQSASKLSTQDWKIAPQRIAIKPFVDPITGRRDATRRIIDLEKVPARAGSRAGAVALLFSVNKWN